MNAPAVFQCLMQQIVQGLNSEIGLDFCAVYLNDIVVFPRSLGSN